ncbi:hypothetical protein DLAC_05238 [Tieghemostelium lacteum]|uniref:Uncharacterized protein n=1 Tax=Tieghemostelium lacteum TaxID=361077 RepID=A0A151ZIW5_TIELA|nr:hypothetical protein DLAC_05238 [Tieghemostelium lacteum]|eukprot:KYQ93839.1 hypothetical protein DLAC_05238 [Tieghemostelium lacteum]
MVIGNNFNPTFIISTPTDTNNCTMNSNITNSTTSSKDINNNSNNEKKKLCNAFAYGGFIQRKDILCSSNITQHEGHRLKLIYDYEFNIVKCEVHSNHLNLVCLDCHSAQCGSCRMDTYFFHPTNVSHFFNVEPKVQMNIGDQFLRLKQYQKALKHFIDAVQRGNIGYATEVANTFALVDPIITNPKSLSETDLVLVNPEIPTNKFQYLFKDSNCSPILTIEACIALKNARNGNVESQFQVGLLLIHGIGLPQNIDSGIMYLELAAQKNHPEACVALGQYYFQVQKKIREAQKWYLRVAIDTNYPRANIGQGDCLRFGDVSNLSASYVHYMSAAYDDEPEAFYALGELYMDNRYRDKSLFKAQIFYMRAAQLQVKSAIDKIKAVHLLIHETALPPQFSLELPEKSYLSKHLNSGEFELFKREITLDTKPKFPEHFTSGVYFDSQFKELSKPSITPVNTTEKKERNVTVPLISPETNASVKTTLPDVKIFFLVSNTSFQICTEINKRKNDSQTISKAIKSYKAIINTEQSASILTLGMMYYQSGKTDKAIKCFKKSANLMNIKACYLLSLCHLCDSDFSIEMALEWAKSGVYYDNLDTINLKKNNVATDSEYKSNFYWLNDLRKVYRSSTQETRDSIRLLIFQKVIEFFMSIGKNSQIIDNKFTVIYNEKVSNIVVANLYYYGIGLGENFQKAFQLYELGGNIDNDPRGYIGMGLMTLRGHGCKSNISVAQQYFKKAAEMGDINAHCYVGYLQHCLNPNSTDLEKTLTLNLIDRTENVVDFFKLHFNIKFPDNVYFHGK